MRFRSLRTGLTARSGSMGPHFLLVSGFMAAGLGVGLGLWTYRARADFETRMASLHARRLKHNLLEARMDEMHRRNDIRAAEVLKTCNTIKTMCEQRQQRTMKRCAVYVEREIAEQIRLFKLLFDCNDENERLLQQVAETEARYPPHDGI